jgi:hypothetical protein
MDRSRLTDLVLGRIGLDKEQVLAYNTGFSYKSIVLKAYDVKLHV